MELFDIKYFCAIVENKSFSKTSSVVHISQPALSQCIQKMEKELGTPLFQRSTRPMSLTEVGKLVYEYGKQILEIKQNLDTSITELIHSDDVQIKIGISPFYSKHYLPEILTTIRKKYPNIQLMIVEDISDNLEALLKQNKIDFCCIPQDPEVEGLSYETICMEEILVAIPQNSPLNNYAIAGNPIPFIDLKKLAGQKLVSLKQVQKINQLLSSLFKTDNLYFQIAYETLDWDTVNLMIANSVGIGFVPDILSFQDFGKKTPKYYRITANGFVRKYSIAYISEKTFTPLERYLISIFKSSIQQTRNIKMATKLR